MPNFLTHCRKITIYVIKICFPGVSLARRARLLTRLMQPPPQIQPPNVSGYVDTPYSRSSHSGHDGCLPEGYPDLFFSAHLPPPLSLPSQNPPIPLQLSTNI